MLGFMAIFSMCIFPYPTSTFPLFWCANKFPVRGLTRRKCFILRSSEMQWMQMRAKGIEGSCWRGEAVLMKWKHYSNFWEENRVMMLSIKSLGYCDSLIYKLEYKTNSEQKVQPILRTHFQKIKIRKIVVDRLTSLITVQCSFTDYSNLLYTICHPSEEPNTRTQQQ